MMETNTNAKVQEKVSNWLNQANPEEISVLENLIEGLERKQKGKSRTYLNGVMNYQGGMVDKITYEAKINITPFIMNPLNIVHGGITATFADTAMGTLVHEVLPEELTSVTSEIKVNYIKPGVGKQMICRATLLHQGRQLCVVQADILSDTGQRIAFVSGTFFVIPKP